MSDQISTLIAERHKRHGDFETTASVAQAIKSAWRGVLHGENNHLSPEQVESLDLISTKMARIVCGNADEPDHWLDIEGYARLARNRLEGKGDVFDDCRTGQSSTGA